MTPAAQFNQRATFRERVRMGDGGGGSLYDWVDRFSRWVAIEHGRPSQQAEAISGGAQDAFSRALLILRDDPDTKLITTEWRLLYDGENWDVSAVQVDKANGTRRLAITKGKPA